MATVLPFILAFIHIFQVSLLLWWHESIALGSTLKHIALFYKCAWKVLLSHCLCFYIQCPTGKQIMLKPDGHGYLYAWQMATHSTNKNFKKTRGSCISAIWQMCQNCYCYDFRVGKLPHEFNFFIKINKKAWYRKFQILVKAMFLGYLIIWFSTVWLCLLGWWIIHSDTRGCKVRAIKDNVFGTYQLHGTFPPSFITSPCDLWCTG